MDITGLSEGVYDCNLIVSDPNADNSSQIVIVTLKPKCFPYNHPDYQEWKSVGEPNCWCWPRQCYGDVDNQMGGTPKFGYFYVGGYDLQLLFNNWHVLQPPRSSGIPPDCLDVP